MNRYRANGNPVDRPANPPVRWAQENGTAERWWRWSMSAATHTATMMAT